MIRERNPLEDKERLLAFLRKDNSRNYFIRLGLESERPSFECVFEELSETGELIATLFKRCSGNLQFYSDGIYDVSGFGEILKTISFDTLISPGTCCDPLCEAYSFESVREGAYLAKLTPEAWRKKEAERSLEKKVADQRKESGSSSEPENKQIQIHPLSEKDLPEVLHLYSEVFSSFSPETVMRKKLQEKRGRGLCLRVGNGLVSVVQTEFEELDSAVIVGVATAVGYEGQGFATRLLRMLISELTEEGKTLYLQYDNMKAGSIYGSLGFTVMDRVKHYKVRNREERK